MIHTIYTHISRRSGCAAHLISLVTLVGGMELLTQFFI